MTRRRRRKGADGEGPIGRGFDLRTFLGSGLAAAVGSGSGGLGRKMLVRGWPGREVKVRRREGRRRRHWGRWRRRGGGSIGDAIDQSSFFGKENSRGNVDPKLPS